jgi:hypothetical protein
MHLTYRDPLAHTGMVSAPSAETGAPEVEITPAMIDAGLDVLADYDPGWTNEPELVSRIFSEMLLHSRLK